MKFNRDKFFKTEFGCELQNTLNIWMGHYKHHNTHTTLSAEEAKEDNDMMSWCQTRFVAFEIAFESVYHLQLEKDLINGILYVNDRSKEETVCWKLINPIDVK